MDDLVAAIIGKRIRAARLEKGVSLRQFAADNDFNPNVISRIERGDHNITIETLFRLCRVLDLSPAEVLRGLR